MVLFLQRLIIAGMSNEELPEIFQYELSTYPPALFDTKNVMRVANKPALTDAMGTCAAQHRSNKLYFYIVIHKFTHLEQVYLYTINTTSQVTLDYYTNLINSCTLHLYNDFKCACLYLILIQANKSC